MPFMGGMEATELIRSYEMHKSLEPTPIIALTAHASAYIYLSIYFISNTFDDLMVSLVIGDRERCLQAGMVSINRLVYVIRLFLMFPPYSFRTTILLVRIKIEWKFTFFFVNGSFFFV